MRFKIKKSRNPGSKNPSKKDGEYFEISEKMRFYSLRVLGSTNASIQGSNISSMQEWLNPWIQGSKNPIKKDSKSFENLDKQESWIKGS